jgi:hypothetical protein
MFARLTTAETKIARIAKLVKIYEESVVPAAKKQKGYCGAYLLIDRKTGKGVSVTLWDCEGDALANEKNRYYQEQLVKFMNILTKPPIREGYEVVFQD